MLSGYEILPFPQSPGYQGLEVSEAWKLQGGLFSGFQERGAPSLELPVQTECSAFFPYFNNYHTQASCGVFTLPTLINNNEEKKLLGPLGEPWGRCWAKLLCKQHPDLSIFPGPQKGGEAGPRLWRPHSHRPGCLPIDRLLGRIGAYPAERGGADSSFWVCPISPLQAFSVFPWFSVPPVSCSSVIFILVSLSLLSSHPSPPSFHPSPHPRLASFPFLPLLPNSG